jgi:hypothetical protein
MIQIFFLKGNLSQQVFILRILKTRHVWSTIIYTVEKVFAPQES